jgi:hypothetical protein
MNDLTQKYNHVATPAAISYYTPSETGPLTPHDVLSPPAAGSPQSSLAYQNLQWDSYQPGGLDPASSHEMLELASGAEDGDCSGSEQTQRNIRPKQLSLPEETEQPRNINNQPEHLGSISWSQDSSDSELDDDIHYKPLQGGIISPEMVYHLFSRFVIALNPRTISNIMPQLRRILSSLLPHHPTRDFRSFKASMAVTCRATLIFSNTYGGHGHKSCNWLKPH